MQGNAPVQVSPSEQQFVTRQWISIVMLVVFILDIIANFDKEYKYIWNNSPATRCLLLLSHGIIWGLTLRKRSLGNRLHIPLIQIDFPNLVLKAIAAILIPFAHRIMLVSSEEFVVLCPMIMFSIVGCRIVLNLQENGDSPEYIQEDVELPEMTSN
ncbi:hypothetical protein BDQ17DRAFT_1329983 [Cyathus striatus]|nr:hypothetical protein BDQ17DRAFT_1329983 [Cyathus striatus]